MSDVNQMLASDAMAEQEAPIDTMSMDMSMQDVIPDTSNLNVSEFDPNKFVTEYAQIPSPDGGYYLDDVLMNFYLSHIDDGQDDVLYHEYEDWLLNANMSNIVKLDEWNEFISDQSNKDWLEKISQEIKK